MPLRMRSLIPHDLCHGQSSSCWPPAVEEKGIRSNRIPEKQWTEFHIIVQEAVTKTIPKKKKCKKTKWLSEKTLQIPEKRREVKGKREQEIYR